MIELDFEVFFIGFFSNKKNNKSFGIEFGSAEFWMAFVVTRIRLIIWFVDELFYLPQG